MALVVFLKGVNVGGHRTFRPSVLAKQLERFDVVNIGAAGTFVVRGPVNRTKLRAELMRRLPFETDVMICSGADVLRLISSEPFVGHSSGRDVVPFVSVLAKRRQTQPPVPIDLPASGDWCLRILARHDRFVLGVYRRQMKAISYLAHIEKLFNAPATTRNWNTIVAIGRILRP